MIIVMINTKRMMVLDKGMERVPLTFTRASVAYDYQGNSVPVNTPRFEHLIGGNIERGVLIEEEHTNLLTANQSTCTDTSGDTTGFVAQGSVPATISSSEEEYIQGSKSLKCVCDGSVYSQGAYVRPTVSIGTTYTISGWIKADKGVSIRIGVSGSTYTVYTGTGDWQLIYHTHTATATAHNYGINTTLATETTFYVDMLQLTATAYPLSWTLGGTTMAAETLTAPAVMNNTTGTIELEVLANNIIKTDGLNNYFIDTADGDGNNQISLLDDSSNNLTITTKASDAATSVSYADSNLTSNTMFKVAAPYKSDKLKLFKDGSSVGTPLTSANLPTTKQTIYLGSKYDGTLQANTLIRNVVLTKQDRVDGEITNRSYRDGFGVDRQVTLIAPLKNNLNAYRVATV